MSGAVPAERRDVGLPALIVAVVIFATGSTVSRKLGAPGVVIACYRNLLAALVWGSIMAVQGRRLTWALIRRAGPLGVLFGLNLMAFITGVSHTSIAAAEIIGALTTVIVTPAAAMIYHERVAWRAMPFAAAAFAGVLIVLLFAPPRGANSWLGNTWIVGAVGLWATYLLTSKRLRVELPLADLMTAMSLCGGLVLLPFVVLGGQAGAIEPGRIGWLALMVLTNGVLAHAAILIAQRTLPLGTISTAQVAQPAIAVMSGALFLSESVRPAQVAGIAVVMISLLGFLRVSQRDSATRPPSVDFQAVAPTAGRGSD